MVKKLALSLTLASFAAGLTLPPPATGMAWFPNAPWNTTKPTTVVSAPEIDGATGAQAIALLSGILLLAGERLRRRRR